MALRYFNIFGPRQAFDSPYFGVLHGQAPTIFGDGRQARDFAYVEDAVQANLLAAAAPAQRVNYGSTRAR